MLAFIDVEARVPTTHPLRTIERLAYEALADLSAMFDPMYAENGRPLIPPERLLSAGLGRASWLTMMQRGQLCSPTKELCGPVG
jgi:hypothetical protein